MIACLFWDWLGGLVGFLGAFLSYKGRGVCSAWSLQLGIEWGLCRGMPFLGGRDSVQGFGPASAGWSCGAVAGRLLDWEVVIP